MKLRAWLASFALSLTFSAVVSAEAAGPSVFHGFDGDPAWYAMVSENGRTLAGWETQTSGPERGVVRRWDGQTWVREYLEEDPAVGVIVASISSDGSVIAGRTEIKEPPYRIGAAVWRRVDGRWVRTDLTPEYVNGHPGRMSADGRVIVGYPNGGYSYGEPSVWEFLDGVWQRTVLPWADPSESVSVGFVSADGMVLAGSAQRLFPYVYRSRGVIWRRTETGWSATLLPVDPMIADGGRIHAMSRDGRSLTGLMLQKTTNYSVGSYVWNLDGEDWRWARLPELVREGRSDPWEISADGGVIIGTADRNDDRTPVRISWKKSEKGEWGVGFAGSPNESDDFPGSLTSDGRIALAQPRMGGWRLWNQINGKLLSMSSLVAGLDVNAEADGWDFNQGEFYWLAYNEQDNTYTILGMGRKNGAATTCVISLYAPFLTGENPTVGGWVDVDLPDMGEEGYRMNVLPPGLRYDAATKRIYGQVTQTGTFTVKYRNLTTGRAKESLLRVVAFSPKQQGIKTVALTPTDSEAPGTGRLRVKVGKAGGVVAHLTLPAGGKPFTFSGVLVPDAESGLFVLRAKRASAEEGCTVRRGKGAAAVQYRVEMEMTKAGAVSARLFAQDGAVIAEGEVAAP